MIKINLNENLREVLTQFDINPDTDYTPAYGGESAGLDLYNSGEDIVVPSITSENFHQTKILIPTGLKMSVPKGYVALIQERGSVTKTPLKVRAGVIDSGYTGEVFVNCINTGNENYTISKGNKLPFQIVVVKCENQFEVVSDGEYLDFTSSSRRKEGQVGSSDK